MRRELLLAVVLILPAAYPVAADTTPFDPTAPTDPGVYRGQDNGWSGGWTLSSTLVGPERRIAIINGDPVREGDRIGGARVLQIRASEVRLQTPGYPLTLRLLANTNRTDIKSRVTK
jgi:MSHA biogenesis protein MshK